MSIAYPTAPVACSPIRRIRPKALLPVAAFAASVVLGSTSRAEPARPYCATSPFERDQRIAVWNHACAPLEAFEEEAEPRADVPTARAADFERVMSTPTGGLDAYADRVAVIEVQAQNPVALWVLTDRAKTRLALPTFDQTNCPSTLQEVWPRFDPKDGSLVLLGFGYYCNNDHEWQWRWREKWVLESGQSAFAGPFHEALRSREPKGSFPALLPGMVDWQGRGDKRQDGLGRFWLVGSHGAFVHDKTRWWQVAGAPSGLVSMAARRGRQVWLSSAYGLYRGTLLPSLVPVARPARPTPPATARPPTPSAGQPLPEGMLVGAKVRRVTFPVTGDVPLVSATSVLASPDRSLHFLDRNRVVVVRGGLGTGSKLAQKPDAPQPLAVSSWGTWLLAGNDVIPFSGAPSAATGASLPAPNAIAIADNVGWALSCRSEDINAVALKYDGSIWVPAFEIPSACYHAVALGPDHVAWMVGGLQVDP